MNRIRRTATTALADEHPAHRPRRPCQRNRHLRSRSGSRSNFAASLVNVRAGQGSRGRRRHSDSVLARTSSTATAADGSGRGFPRQATAGHASRSTANRTARRTVVTRRWRAGIEDLGDRQRWRCRRSPAPSSTTAARARSGHSRTAGVGQAGGGGRSLTLPPDPTHTQSPDPAQARPAQTAFR